ncbi:MAG: helix-turn-helix domain-containing protein [Patescibacteria group bacterium]
MSPQARKLYHILLSQGNLDVNRMSKELKILPPAVYRLARYLLDVGLIEAVSRHPAVFHAVPVSEGQDSYLAHQRSQLNMLFSGLPNRAPVESSEAYHIAFLEGREPIFARVAEDLQIAAKGAKFIVLGLPIGVSQELLLEQRNAVARGVPVYIIVQEYTPENQETIRSWQTQGLTVRVGTPVGFHLLLVDDTISYLMYYEEIDKTKRYAVRIVHKAIHAEFEKIFDSHWKKAKRL